MMAPARRRAGSRGRRRASLITASVCLAVALGATGGCGRESEKDVETTTAVPVEVKPAREGTIRAVVTATGVVTPAPGADLTITAPQPARILDMPKAEGDQVRKGELLVRFQIPSLDADIAARRADVSRASARLQNAKAAAARAADLFDRGVAARKDIEDAQRDLAEADAAVAEARAASGATSLLADRAVARARFDGIVARRWHNPGDLVDAATADPILRVIDPRHLQVEASIPALDVARVMQGASARVVGPGGPPAESASVVSRPAALDPTTATATVRLAFDRPTPLAAGTPVQIEISAEERRSVIVVPAGAIVQEGPATFVFVAGADSKAHRRSVAVGLVAGADAEIRSGVAAGDRIITRGQAALPDGATITVSP